MITEAQLAANRANAQKSTGPATPEGKARSSRNSFKHGLYSKQLVISGEEAAALDELKADLRTEHQPANETEGILVNEMAEQFWRLRRTRLFEASVLDSETVVFADLAVIQRMMSSAERGFHKALTALRQLQKDRGSRSEPASALGFVPQKDQSGFVPTNSVSESATPPATEPRPQGSGATGFVPPSCPGDEDIDPADWARAFEARRRVHAKLQS